MATCSLQPLLDDGACFGTLTAGQQAVAALVLLCRLLQAVDPMAECDIQGLLDDGACFAALMPGQQRVAELQLLCEVNSILTGAACTPTDPNGVEIGLYCGQLITALDTGAKYTFQGTVGTKVGWA